MTHAHDRTLLATLGFADPDKRDERHYSACKFLVQPDVLRDIAARYVPAPQPDYDVNLGGADKVVWVLTKDLAVDLVPGSLTVDISGAGCELAISKGDGQYKQTIGFADAWFVARSRAEYTYRRADGAERTTATGQSFATIFEVKIGAVGVDSVLRQFALYKEHLAGRRFPFPGPPPGPAELAAMEWHALQWVLATPYSLSVSDAAILRAHGIRHIRLGPRFEAFCAQQKAEASESGFEL